MPMQRARKATEVRTRAEDLRSGRSPFVLATVVRTERPASTRTGDRALILPDGTVEGFVGGTCAEAAVRTQGLRLLKAGSQTGGAADPVLLRIRPESGEGSGSGDVPEPEEPERPGMVTVANPCLSGGTIEVFLEAVLPPPVVYVHGDTPVAEAMADLGAGLGYEVRPVGGDAAAGSFADATAVVVASHGRGEEAVLTAALRVGVEYVGLVASPRRGAAVVAGIELGANERERVRTPAGLDIGARFPAEIALSILAEIVAARPRAPKPGQPERKAPAVATDPVCDMDVAVTPEALSCEHDGRTWYFCGPGCRARFSERPGDFIE